ncbi:MAG: aromatic aminobenezylarsenical efflux permease ArsG family transporter [Candidatus Omnitrophota bacterium]
MFEILIVFASALWLGVLTSISPCPLATNIAAVSFLSKKINYPKAVLLAGVVYTAGRMTAYALLGVIIITSLASVPLVANFLQKYMNKILGPVLLIVGFILLDIIRFNLSGIILSKERQESIAQRGVQGAFALGVLFALAFCPISAALFFGSLITVSLNTTYGVILPLIYGIGTGLPVLVFSFGIAFGISRLSHWFNKIAMLEKHTRKITGIIFIIVGLYFIWVYVVSVIQR